MVDEPLGDGAGGSGVVKERPPLFEREIGSDDGGASLVALVEDLVQEVGATGVEAEIAELVDQEQVIGRPGGESADQGVAGLGGDEVVDEVDGKGEAHAMATQARELADRVGDVGLADAAWADEDAVGLVGDEVERGSATHEVAVDLFGVVEVVGVERGQREDSRAFERTPGPVLLVDTQLLAHQGVEQRRRPVLACDGLFERPVE